MRLTGVSLIAIAMGCSMAGAQEGVAPAGSPDETLLLDPIILHAASGQKCRKVASPNGQDTDLPLCIGLGTERDGLPGATMDRAEFGRLPTGARVQDVIKRLPGVFTGGGPGEDKDARVLGLDKEYTRTTIDGIQLPDGGEKREFNLDRLSSSLVESVEVIRSRRAEMEADGIAGRVDIKLRDIPREREIAVQGAVGAPEGGDIQQWHSLTAGGMLNETFGAQGAVSWSKVPNIKTKTKTDKDGVTLAETEDEVKDVTSTDFLGDFLWQTDDTAVRFKPTWLNQVEDKDKTKAKYKSDGSFNGSETEAESKTKRTVGGAFSVRHDFDEAFSVFEGATLDARVAYYAGSEDKDKDKATYKADGSEEASKFETEWEEKNDDLLQGEVNLALPFEAGGAHNILKTGLLAKYKTRDKAKTKAKAGIPQAAGEKDVYALEEITIAGYVQNETEFFGAVKITPGLRIEATSLEATSAAGMTSDGDAIDLLPSLPFEVRFSEDWALSGGIARVVTRPKFDLLVPWETSGSDRTTIGNPDLEPERGWAYDVDLDYTSPHLDLGAGVFYRWISDRIEEVATGDEDDDGNPIYQSQNVGDGWTAGVILEERVGLGLLGLEALEGFSITSTQTFARSRLTEYDGTKRPFKEQPDFWGDVALVWSDPDARLSAALALNFTSEITSSGDNGDEVRDAELTLDAEVDYRLTDQITLFALAENLTGTERVKRKADGAVEVEEGARSVYVGLKGSF
ncbi:vitamin B12/cobalamin outer membrane transporter [Methylobrevis pamukkalensis]|uniref:Vitamin B12/cobalamin outer membrane transporter n=2 Tax=Methylobrevis pamukkalensis TaxID=1439726 RepID=A0A1E3H705_9HYPH|nr:vitamin B12/cobalamin outer membrane transporter [Methylobrevis pamukkalensis]